MATPDASIDTGIIAHTALYVALGNFTNDSEAWLAFSRFKVGEKRS